MFAYAISLAAKTLIFAQSLAPTTSKSLAELIWLRFRAKKSYFCWSAQTQHHSVTPPVPVYWSVYIYEYLASKWPTVVIGALFDSWTRTPSPLKSDGLVALLTVTTTRRHKFRPKEHSHTISSCGNLLWACTCERRPIICHRWISSSDIAVRSEAADKHVHTTSDISLCMHEVSTRILQRYAPRKYCYKPISM